MMAGENKEKKEKKEKIRQARQGKSSCIVDSSCVYNA